MGYNEFLVSPVEQLQAQIHETRWIYEFLEQNLEPLPIGSLVVACGCGNCEELPHLRGFAGAEANIIGIDLKKPNNNGLRSIRAARASLVREDYKDVSHLLSTVGKEPDLIVFRNPEITRFVRAEGGYVFIPENIQAIVEWSRCLSIGGQMLVSTYTGFERDELAQGFLKVGITPQLSENDLIPENLRRTKHGVYQFPDGFTLVVRN